VHVTQASSTREKGVIKRQDNLKKGSKGGRERDSGGGTKGQSYKDRVGETRRGERAIYFCCMTGFFLISSPSSGALMRFWERVRVVSGWFGDMGGNGTHLVDVGKDSSSGDGGADERVELLVSSDGELQMTGRDTLHSKILGGVTWGVVVVISTAR
jgi:hypothetical protein